jgi:hypothetical protein
MNLNHVKGHIAGDGLPGALEGGLVHAAAEGELELDGSRRARDINAHLVRAVIAARRGPACGGQREGHRRFGDRCTGTDR